MTGVTCSDSQGVSVNASRSNPSVLSDGSWLVNNGIIRFEMDRFDTSLLGGEYLHALGTDLRQ